MPVILGRGNLGRRATNSESETNRQKRGVVLERQSVKFLAKQA